MPFENKNQLRILDLPGAIEAGRLSELLEPKDVGFNDQDRSDQAMMQEAVQNRILSESFAVNRQLIYVWNLTEIALRAVVDPVKWKNSDQYRSHLGIPIVAEAFYSILAVIQQSLFAGYRPFTIDACSGTSLDTALGMEALVSSQLKRCGYKGGTMKQEMRAVSYDLLLYGTGVGIMGWEEKNLTVRKKRQKHVPADVPVTKDGGSVTVPTGDEDEMEEYDVPLVINHPIFEHVPIRRFRTSPSCRRGNVQTADWAGRIIYLNSYQLDSLRNTEGYNIPSREVLVQLTTPQKMDFSSTNPLDTLGSNVGTNPIFQQLTTPQKANPENYESNTADPLMKDYEIFDYWTADRHVMVLEGEYPILNEIHTFGNHPFLSAAFREAPDSFYGYGLGYWLADFQKMAQGIANLYFDDLNLNLMGTYSAPAGMNNSAQAQYIFPGKIFKYDPGAKMEPMTRNTAFAQEPMGLIGQIKDWATSISGAGAGITGQPPSKPGAMRTPEGVNLLAAGDGSKMTDLIDQISELLFTPFLEFCVEQNARLQPSQLREMLSQELAEGVKVTPINVINGDYKVNISAGPRLQARESLNQYIGFVQSVLQSASAPQLLADAGEKLSFTDFVKVLFQGTALPYRENVIKQMTAEEKAAYQASKQQLPPQLATIKAKSEAKKDEQDNQAENRGILQAQKQAWEHGVAQEENLPGQ